MIEFGGNNELIFMKLFDWMLFRDLKEVFCYVPKRNFDKILCKKTKGTVNARSLVPWSH